MAEQDVSPMAEQYAKWQEAYAAVEPGWDLRANFDDRSRALYTAADRADADEAALLGVPGAYPYTRGVYASMYHTKTWTTRLFSGFGTAAETNERYHALLAAGQDGLSVAFDLPTLMGVDSDDPTALGEVGRCGVAIDTIDDMRRLFAGIPLRDITTSMTINAPAIVLFAMYIVVAEEQGVRPAELGGTIQNDMLKEFHAQKEFYFPPRPSLRVISDMLVYAAKEMPRWHTLSISGYHIREAGSTAAQELAFTLVDGFAYVELGLQAGLDVDTFAPRLSFFFNSHIDFFEEIAKFRAARRIWARWMQNRYQARDPRSLRCRFHAQTAGVSLTAQQPENNIVRTAVEGLAAVLGGAQSLHTNSLDEVLALPTERAAKIALRTQQVLATETGVTNTIDPLGGSYFLESLTDQLEARAEEYFSRVEEMGEGSMLNGVYAGIENGFFQTEIADASYRLQREYETGARAQVGVHVHCEEDEPALDLLRIDASVEERQVKALAQVRESRSMTAVRQALQGVREAAADASANIMGPVCEAVRVQATVGEIMQAMASEFGTYVEKPVL